MCFYFLATLSQAHWCVFLLWFIWGAKADRWKVVLSFLFPTPSPHWSLIQQFYLLSGYRRIYICLLLSAFCLSHVDNRIPQTPTHILPPCKITATGWNKALPPPCTTTCMHSLPQLKWEFEKPDVNLSSIPSEPPPPHHLQVFFFLSLLLLSQSAAFRNTQRWKDRMAMPGSSIRKFLPHYSLLVCHVYEGLFSPFHPYMRRLLESRSVWCGVKVNSWHLIPASWCFISDLFGESKNPGLAQMSRQRRSGKPRQTPSQNLGWLKRFHFVILEFLVMDGSNTRSSQTTSPVLPKHHRQHEASTWNQDNGLNKETRKTRCCLFNIVHSDYFRLTPGHLDLNPPNCEEICQCGGSISSNRWHFILDVMMLKKSVSLISSQDWRVMAIMVSLTGNIIPEPPWQTQPQGPLTWLDLCTLTDHEYHGRVREASDFDPTSKLPSSIRQSRGPSESETISSF